MAASMESSGQSRAATLMNAARRSHFVSRIEKYEAKVRHAKALMKQQKEMGPRIEQRQPVSDAEDWNVPSKQEQKETVSIPEHRHPPIDEEQQRLVSDKLMMVIPVEKTFASDQVGFKTKVWIESAEVVPQKPHERDYLHHTEKHDDPKRDISSDKAFLTQDDVFQKHYRPGSPQQRMCSQQKEIISGMLQRSASSNMKTIEKEFDALDIVTGNALTTEKVFPVEVVSSDSHANVYIDFKPPPTSEVSIAAIAGALKVRIKAADMSASMQEHAFRCARECLDMVGKLQTKRMAYTLKKEFDKVYGPAWHCIVGTSFGSYVTHSLGGFVYFSLDKVSVLLFKTTVEPIENL